MGGSRSASAHIGERSSRRADTRTNTLNNASRHTPPQPPAAGPQQLSEQYGGALDVERAKFTGKLACLDLEGVLIPEVWVNLAEKTGVEALKRTTRDEPVYEKLMRYRLDIMEKEASPEDLDAVIDSMEPLPGAVEMVAWLRERSR